MDTMYASHHFTPHGRYELNKLTSLPMCGFIVQLVRLMASVIMASKLSRVFLFVKSTKKSLCAKCYALVSEKSKNDPTTHYFRNHFLQLTWTALRSISFSSLSSVAINALISCQKGVSNFICVLDELVYQSLSGINWRNTCDPGERCPLTIVCFSTCFCSSFFSCEECSLVFPVDEVQFGLCGLWIGLVSLAHVFAQVRNANLSLNKTALCLFSF